MICPLGRERQEEEKVKVILSYLHDLKAILSYSRKKSDLLT